MHLYYLCINKQSIINIFHYRTFLSITRVKKIMFSLEVYLKRNSLLSRDIVFLDASHRSPDNEKLMG